jgi:octanoyl-[GcvH]:protein N-octanoyltransferase
MIDDGSIPSDGAVVFRGRASDIDADYRITDDVVDLTERTGRSVLRAWRPHRQVAFGPRDRAADGYERARDAAVERGFQPVERRVGGRAVAYTGSTVAFARTRPITDPREGLQDRYERVERALKTALEDLGVDVQSGEPDRSFCPGAHSLQADGKIVGVAQRVTKDVSLTSGIVVVRDANEIAAVLDRVYGELGVPFDPDTVGSVSAAGGPDEPAAVVDSLADALTDGDPSTVRVEDLR